MKLKFFTAALCMVMGLSLSAQTTKDNSKEKTPKQYPSEKMIQDLNLTPKQVTEMKSFFEQQQAEREKFRQEQRTQSQNQKISKEERKTAMEKRRNENRAKIKTILTPDQYTKYLEMQVDKKSKMDKNGKEGPRHDRKGKGCKNQCSNKTKNSENSNK